MKRFLTIFLCLAAISLIFTPLSYAGKATPLISSFNAGELSPKLDLRSDLEKYYSGCRTLENMIPLVEGGATRTPGTYFALETKDSTQASRLIPFQFSTIQSYVIEAGDLYFRFFKDDGLITSVDIYTKLLLHCDGTDAATTFTDSGYTGHSPSANGNAQLDTAQYEFVTASGLFDGTGDYVSISDHADFNFGSNPLTLDLWVMFDSVTGIHTIHYQGDTTAGDYVWIWVDHVKSTLNLRVVDAGVLIVNLSETWAPVDDTWYHVAIIRGWADGADNWALCVNGTVLNAASIDAGTLPNHDSAINIGGLATANTIIDFSDSCHVITKYGNAAIDSTESKWGDASIRFNGSTDYLSVPDSANWDIQTNFTIGLWVRHTDHVGIEEYILHFENGTNNWILYHTHGSGLRFFIYSGGALIVDTGYGGEITDTNWHHVAMCKVGNEYGIYLDGTQIAHTSDADTDTFAGLLRIAVASANFFDGYMDEIYISHQNYFGAAPDAGLTDTITPPTTPHTSDSNTKLLVRTDLYDFDGWKDEFRVSKGVARWTANFTPPTQEYPFADTGVLTGGGYAVYEVTTPYVAADVFEIKTVQSADYLYLFHPDYPPKTLTRTSHTSWTLGEMHTMIGDAMTITAISKAATAVVTCTTVPTSLAMGDIVYISGGDMTQVADLYFTTGTVVTGGSGTFELLDINSTGYTTYTTGATAQENLYGTTDNQPSCGAFFEQRLALGGSNNQPQTINLSMSADYDNFTTGSSDDDAIQYTILSERVDRVYWMVGLDSLMIGTVGGVWKLGASTTGAPVTPSDITTKKQVTMGAKNIQPEIVTDSLLWVTRAGTSLRQLVFSFEVDKYISPDMTRIAKHIALGDSRALSGITQIDFQREPLPILWAIRADGELLGLTYETQENIYAWFRVTTEGTFESIAVISEEDVEDQVWVIVNRTLDSGTVRYVEYFKPIEFFGEIEDGFFVHSGLTWDGGDAVTITLITKASTAVVTAAGHTLNDGDKVRIQDVVGMTEINIGTDTAYTVASSDPDGGTFELSGIDTSGSGYTTYDSGGTVTKVTNSLSNLTHLEAKSVAILVDGVKHDAETVSSSAVSLDLYGNKIHVGLAYTSIVEPMKLNAGAQLGTARGKKQRIHKITVGFYETGDGVEYGPDQTDLKDFTGFASGALTTDDLEVVFHGDWGDEATISIVQEDPLPMTILGIVPYVTVNEN